MNQNENYSEEELDRLVKNLPEPQEYKTSAELDGLVLKYARENRPKKQILFPRWFFAVAAAIAVMLVVLPSESAISQPVVQEDSLDLSELYYEDFFLEEALNESEEELTDLALMNFDY